MEPNLLMTEPPEAIRGSGALVALSHLASGQISLMMECFGCAAGQQKKPVISCHRLLLLPQSIEPLHTYQYENRDYGTGFWHCILCVREGRKVGVRNRAK